MEWGDKILILPSIALTKLGLSELAGQTAVIVTVNKGRNNRIIGCWVKLKHQFRGKNEWFIPNDSII